MWFVTDRDESTDAEIGRMIERLGGRAKLKVLPKREIENYLLESRAIATFLEEKQKAGGISSPKPTPEDVERVLNEEAKGLRDEVIRLRLERRLLTPVFLRTRANTGTIEERINSAIKALGERLQQVEGEKASIVGEIDKSWPARALDYVPGTLLLERVAKRFGVSFSKDKGDSERLARHMRSASVDYELKELLNEITQEEVPAA